MRIYLMLAAMAFFPFLFAFAAEGAQKPPKVELETSEGKIVIELFPEKAPATVANFLSYVKSGFFDGTLFHRVIPGFMIQGGGYSEGMGTKETLPPIKNEADNGLKNERGTVAMARTNDPHSATGQFFINLVNNGFLDHQGKNAKGWGYAVFGKVVEGMDAVDKISKVKTGTQGGFQDVPLKPVLIKKAKTID